VIWTLGLPALTVLNAMISAIQIGAGRSRDGRSPIGERGGLDLIPERRKILRRVLDDIRRRAAVNERVALEVSGGVIYSAPKTRSSASSSR